MDIRLGKKRTLTIYPHLIIYGGRNHSFSIGLENKRWRGTGNNINEAYLYGIHLKRKRSDVYFGESEDSWICFPVSKNHMFCSRYIHYFKDWT